MNQRKRLGGKGREGEGRKEFSEGEKEKESGEKNQEGMGGKEE